MRNFPGAKNRRLKKIRSWHYKKSQNYVAENENWGLFLKTDQANVRAIM